MQNHIATKRLGIFSAVLGCALLLGGSVSAQESQDEQDDAPGGIESITVTAEKREADLQDMGVSIQAFSGQDLERHAVYDTVDLGAMVPGLTFVPSVTYSSELAVAGRGLIHPANHTMVQSTVGLYMDGVYITTGDASMLQLLDIESIEFLKGPQGTLFGRNSVGGAVIINTKRPTSKFEGRINVRLGNYGKRDIGGSLNVPLLDETLFGRFSWLRTRRDGFWDNDLPGNEFDFSDDHNDAGRFALRWLASDSVTVDYIFDWQQLDEGPSASPVNHVYEQVPPGGVSQRTGTACVTASFLMCDEYGRVLLSHLIRPPALSSAPDWEQGLIAYNWRDPDTLYYGGRFQGLGNKKTSRSHSLTLDYEISESLTFKFLGGYHEYRKTGLNDHDGTPLSLGESGANIDYETRNAEFQLVGSLLEGAADFVVGFMYFDDEYDHDQFADLFSTRDTFAPLNSSSFNTGETIAVGYFAHLNYRPWERWEFSVGIRYSSEHKENSRSRCGDGRVIDTYQRATPANCLVPAGTDTSLPPDGIQDIFFDLSRDARFSAWSPMARVKYYWTDEVMTYLKWAKGFSSGGFGPLAANGGDAANAAFEPELLYSWELGFKTRWFGDRLQFNGAAFYDEHKDQQITTFIPGQGAATRVDNAGRSRIRGWEFDLRALPFEGLELILNHAFTHATFSEYIIGLLPDGTPNNQAHNRVFRHTPKRKWGGTARYTFASQSWGTPELGVTFIRESPRHSHGVPVQNIHVDSNTYTHWNSRLSVYDAGGIQGLSVSLQVQNLGDRRYIYGQGVDFGALGWTDVSISDPRTWFVELAYEF